jgi:hypothetical protein
MGILVAYDVTGRTGRGRVLLSVQGLTSSRLGQT